MRFNKSLFAAIILIISARLSFAQSASDVIFFEAGGNGIILSANYERFIDSHTGIRIGFGNVLSYGTSYPVMINYYPGNSNNRLEIGGGIIYFAGKIDDKFFGNNESLLLGTTIGLRHQKPSGGTVVRVNVTPFYNPKTSRLLLSGGLSVGYAF